MKEIAHRQGETLLTVTDAAGQPMPGAVIRCELTDHEFLFGCGAFEALPYVMRQSDRFTPEDRARLEDRMEKWLALFNYGTLPFYWGQFEPEEGKPHTELLRYAAGFLSSRGVALKGHTLCWQTVGAKWLLPYDDDAILEKQTARVRREVTDFRGLVDRWDVVNEAVIMPEYSRYENAATRICRKLGRVELIRRLFAEAHAADPDALLLLNDFNTSDRYARLIADCLDAGAPIGCIGIQSHQHQGVWGREKTDAVLARFEGFGLPIHFTENTIVAGPLVAPEIDDLQDAHYADDAATPEYEEAQADALEDMVRNLFENHPLVTAVTNWDFGDGAWLNAPSGLIRRDGALKPVYHRLRRLIREEWTADVTLRTDEAGRVLLRGYRGLYRVTSGEKQGMLRLDAHTPRQTVALTPGRI